MRYYGCFSPTQRTTLQAVRHWFAQTIAAWHTRRVVLVQCLGGPNICVKLTVAPVELARLGVKWAQPQLTPAVGRLKNEGNSNLSVFA